MKATPPAPARALRRLVQRLGMHPEDTGAPPLSAQGRRALVVATNHGTLGNGKPTGVFASELTVPYYYFLDAGMQVDVASPLGGTIPVDPMSLKPVLRTDADDRYLDAIADQLVAASYGFQDLVLAIVGSDPFLQRHGEPAMGASP